MRLPFKIILYSYYKMKLTGIKDIDNIILNYKNQIELHRKHNKIINTLKKKCFPYCVTFENGVPIRTYDNVRYGYLVRRTQFGEIYNQHIGNDTYFHMMKLRKIHEKTMYRYR